MAGGSIDHARLLPQRLRSFRRSVLSSKSTSCDRPDAGLPRAQHIRLPEADFVDSDRLWLITIDVVLLGRHHVVMPSPSAWEIYMGAFPAPEFLAPDMDTVI